MTHILVECPELVVSASLGVLAPLKPLEERGDAEVRFRRSAEIRRQDVVWADILVTVRGCEPLTVHIVREARKIGRMIVYYLDDDLLDVPEESGAYTYYRDPVIRSGMLSILGMTDVLWGVNPNIREKYLPLTGGGRWAENRVAKALCAQAGQRESGLPIKVLYAGSTDHVVIVREILSPVVRRICAEYGDGVDVTFIGVDPGLSELKNVRYIPFIKPYEAYTAFVESGGFSIGLAPGRTTPFFGCKYYNKFLEYTAIGAVGVYTLAQPYTQIVRDRENGMLCRNTEEDWYAAVKALLDDPALLRRCAAGARALLADRFNTHSVTEDFTACLPELCTFRAPEAALSDVRLRNGLWLFYVERAKLLWRQKGLWGIPEMLLRSARIVCKLLFRGRGGE